MKMLKVLILAMLAVAIASPVNGIVIPPGPADLVTIEKEADKEEYCPGETIQYIITIYNQNEEPNCGVTILELIDTLPDGNTVDVLSTCGLGESFNLGPGEEKIIDNCLIYTVPEDAAPGTLENNVDCSFKGDWCKKDWCVVFHKSASCDVEIEDCNVGYEGCTPGYWKNNLGCWEFSWPNDLFSDAFGGVFIALRTGGKKTNIVHDPSLLQALDANGGGTNALARHAVAALLNACDEDINYPMTVNQVINEVWDVLVFDGDVEELKDELAIYNELGCGQNSDNAKNPCSPSDD